MTMPKYQKPHLGHQENCTIRANSETPEVSPILTEMVCISQLFVQRPEPLHVGRQKGRAIFDPAFAL
jgi:hypothetical protein